MSVPAHILLVNVHSALNLGDDAIMSVTLTSLRAVYPHSRITIAATDPDSWRNKYVAIDIIGSLTAWVIDRTHSGWRWQKSKLPIYAALLVLAVVVYRVFHAKWLFGSSEQRRLLSAYYAADLVLSCGGGNFYAHRRLSPALLWAFLTLGLATALGKSTIMLPQSIGPIEGRFQRWLARRIFDRSAKILLREQQSAAFLRVL